MEATKEVLDVVKRNYMSWRVAQRYARYFVPDKAPIPTELVRLEYVAERRLTPREFLDTANNACASIPFMFASGLVSHFTACLPH